MTDNQTNLIENQAFQSEKLSKNQNRRQNSPPTSPEKITSFLPRCKCGGHAVWWNEIITASNILYWVECSSCGYYRSVKRSKEAAFQDWTEWVDGIIRKKVLWMVPY